MRCRCRGECRERGVVDRGSNAIARCSGYFFPLEVDRCVGRGVVERCDENGVVIAACRWLRICEVTLDRVARIAEIDVGANEPFQRAGGDFLCQRRLRARSEEGRRGVVEREPHFVRRGVRHGGPTEGHVRIARRALFGRREERGDLRAAVLRLRHIEAAVLGLERAAAVEERLDVIDDVTRRDRAGEGRIRRRTEIGERRVVDRRPETIAAGVGRSVPLEDDLRGRAGRVVRRCDERCRAVVRAWVGRGDGECRRR